MQAAKADSLTKKQAEFLNSLNFNILTSFLPDVKFCDRDEQVRDCLTSLPLLERAGNSSIVFAMLVKTFFPDDLIDTMDTYA